LGAQRSHARNASSLFDASILLRLQQVRMAEVSKLKVVTETLPSSNVRISLAGDLNGEFYQLYAALRKEGIGDKPALDYLATVNERGRQYRFHDPMFN
jgi:hypothetical protein